MSGDVQREEWMTKELERKLLDISKDNSLTCTEIQEFASEKLGNPSENPPPIDRLCSKYFDF